MRRWTWPGWWAASPASTSAMAPGRRRHMLHRGLRAAGREADLLGAAVAALRPARGRPRPRVVRAGAADRRHRPLRHGPRAGHRPRRHRHGADPHAHGEALSLGRAGLLGPLTPFALELGLGALLLIVFVGGLVG